MLVVQKNVLKFDNLCLKFVVQKSAKAVWFGKNKAEMLLP